MTPIIHQVDADHTIATWDRVLIQIWRGSPTNPMIVEMAAITRQLIGRTQPDKICSISIVEPTSPPPKDETRRQLAAFFKDITPHSAELLIVNVGGGFRAALIRGVGLALSTLSPKSLPFRFVDSIPTAVELVSRHLSPLAGGPKALDEALQFARTKEFSVASSAGR